MTKIKCPSHSCRKEFETPVLVTNFTFTPTKETYPACPYCLTRIDESSRTCDYTSAVESMVDAKPEKIETHNNSKKEFLHDLVPFERIGALEQQKLTLLAEVDELRKCAAKKISKLEEEIAALKEEKQALEQLID